ECGYWRHARRTQGGHETEYPSRQEGQRTREREQPPAVPEIEFPRARGGGEHADAPRSSHGGEEEADRAGSAGDDGTFDEQLLDQAAAARADRQEQRHLVLAARCASQEQVGDIRSGDEQNQRSNRGEDPERTLELAANRRWTIS